jgi:Kef-type K+ transport system membrane component KefB
MLLAGLAVIIVLARSLGIVAKWIGQPPVVGEVVAGILLGPTFFGTAVSGRLFPTTEVRPALLGLANVGLVLFMFIVGYELDHTLVRGRERVALSVSIGSILLPFSLGAALALWLARNHGVPKVLPFALFIGAAMSVTAFPVLARILTDRSMHRIQIGSLALASAAVDDILAWSLLALVVTVSGNGVDQWHIVLAVPYVLVMFLVVRPLLGRVAKARERAGRLTPDLLAIVLIGLLLSCYVTEWLGVHFIFGAFIFGVIMPRAGGDALRHEILEKLEQVSVLLLLPVFFVMSGLRVDLSHVDTRGWLELVLILAVAIVGKFVGAYVGARLQGVANRQAGALATLMNTRGLTEIVILTVGLQLKILDTRLFSLMVVMALVTTGMAGPLLALIYPRQRVERDIAETERKALGVVDAYRVLVAVESPEADTRTVALSGDLVGERRPAEVVLSYLMPYRTPRRLEVGSGLSGELLEMTRVMAELDQLAASVRSRGLAAPVLARFSTDPARELSEQAAAINPDLTLVGVGHPAYGALRTATPGRFVTVVAPPPDQWDAVIVRVPVTANAEAALSVAAQLAMARDVELVVDAGPRVQRRLSSIVDNLRQQQVAIRFGADGTPGGLIVVADGTEVGDAHLTVRDELASDRQPAPDLARATG